MILLNYLLIYISFIILLQLLVEVESQTALKPDTRAGHTATLINNKLYILGGYIPSEYYTPPKETFLCLDVSVPFNTNELKWNDLSATTNNIVSPHRYAAAIKGGANNNTLFLYGGVSSVSPTGEAMGLVYTFDIQNNLWSVPKITGIPPFPVGGISPVIDYNGLMYLFGGTTSDFGAYTNDMFVLDTINLSWKKVSSNNAPSPRVQYGAVFLPQNKSIIYMGGFNLHTVGAFPLDEVYLYDTVNDVWTTKPTNGLIPSLRYGFTTVLGLDEQRVIIFGGVENNVTNKRPENSLYVLSLNDFNWYTPKLPGKIPPSRAFHKSVVIGKYMVVTFGNGTQGNESDILLLDISNNDEYIWTTTFEPLPLTAPSSHTGIIVGTAVGGSILFILLATGSFFLYRRHKNYYFQEIFQIQKEKNSYSQHAIDYFY